MDNKSPRPLAPAGRAGALRLDALAGWTARPASIWGPVPLDPALAVAGIAAAVIEAVVSGSHVEMVAWVLPLVAGGPLAFRRVAPVRALLVSAAGAIATAAWLHASWSVSVIVALQLLTVALLGDRRRSLLVGVLTAIVVILAELLIDPQFDAGALISRVTLVIVAVAAGELIRTRAELAEARRERAEQEARERAEQLQRTAAAERLAVARELHDSLGHFLVAINVRASVAVEVPETQDPVAALSDIKQVSASALRDLRSTLSVLREQGETAPTAPTPQLESLVSIVDRATASGVKTTLALEVDHVAIPAATTAATIRIVQESMTNVLRHSQARAATVAVRARGDTLVVEISDDGTASTVNASAGFGVRGMTERATALGGSLQAGRRSGGGWTVLARLPLTGEDER